jgi:hypothetical protein
MSVVENTRTSDLSAANWKFRWHTSRIASLPKEIFVGLRSMSYAVGSDEWKRAKMEAMAVKSNPVHSDSAFVISEQTVGKDHSEKRFAVGSDEWKQQKMREKAAKSIAVGSDTTAQDSDQIVFGVAVGREIGVFDSWEACSRSTKGYPAAQFKGFPSRDAATKWVIAESARIEAAELAKIQLPVDGSDVIKQAYDAEHCRCCLHFGQNTFLCGWANCFFPFACTVGPHWYVAHNSGPPRPPVLQRSISKELSALHIPSYLSICLHIPS